MNKPLFNLLNLLLFISFVLLPARGILGESQEALPFNWQLNIKWKGVPLAEIPIPDTRIKVIDGYADIFLTLDNSAIPQEVSYKAKGNIDKCEIYLSEWNEEIHQISSNFAIEDKELKLSSLEGKFKNTPFTANANISLTVPYSFEANIKARDIKVEDVSLFFPFLKAYNMIEAPAEAEFNIKRELPSSPLEGKILLAEASLYSLLMNNIEISFIWDDNKVVVRNVSANLSEGKISGEGEILIKNLNVNDNNQTPRNKIQTITNDQ